jgi:hypothetical protein
MAQAVDEAKQQRDVTKESLARNLELLETRVRTELDWKSRLRRDGARYAVYGGVALAGVVGLFVLRKAVGRRGSVPEPVQVTSLDDLVAELSALRGAVEKGEKKARKDNAPVWQSLIIKGIAAAAAAGATAAVRQFMENSGGETEAEHSQSR